MRWVGTPDFREELLLPCRSLLVEVQDLALAATGPVDQPLRPLEEERVRVHRKDLARAREMCNVEELQRNNVSQPEPKRVRPVLENRHHLTIGGALGDDADALDVRFEHSSIVLHQASIVVHDHREIDSELHQRLDCRQIHREMTMTYEGMDLY